jgi:hypothetical protein
MKWAKYYSGKKQKTRDTVIRRNQASKKEKVELSTPNEEEKMQKESNILITEESP